MWLLVTILLVASPDRTELIEAWEAAIAEGATLTKSEDGYRLVEPDLGYDGPVSIVATSVDTYPSDFGLGVTHQGTVDYRLDVEGELAESMVYYNWIARHQTFYFIEPEQRWIDQLEFNARLTAGAPPAGLFAGLWPLIGMVLFLLAVLWFAGRQAMKAKGLMTDSMDINRMARENIEDAGKLHAEQREAQREILELARRQTALLEEIRDRVGKD